MKLKVHKWQIPQAVYVIIKRLASIVFLFHLHKEFACSLQFTALQVWILQWN